MKVSEAINILSSLDPDADLMFDGSRGVGNLIDIFHAWKDEYGFFGKSVPCVILSDRTRREREQALKQQALKREGEARP